MKLPNLILSHDLGRLMLYTMLLTFSHLSRSQQIYSPRITPNSNKIAELPEEAKKGRRKNELEDLLRKINDAIDSVNSKIEKQDISNGKENGQNQKEGDEKIKKDTIKSGTTNKKIGLYEGNYFLPNTLDKDLHQLTATTNKPIPNPFWKNRSTHSLLKNQMMVISSSTSRDVDKDMDSKKSEARATYNDILDALQKADFYSRSEIVKLQKDAKELYRKKIDNVYEDASISYGILSEKYKLNNSFFPARNRHLSRYYYNNNDDKNVEALRNNYFNINSSASGSIYSELVAGYLLPFRLSFGIMVSKSELESISSQDIEAITGSGLDSAGYAQAILDLDKKRMEVEEANQAKLNAQSFLAAGGNALLSFSTAIINYNSTNKILSFNSTAFYSIGMLLPEIGTTSEDVDMTHQIGILFDSWIDISIDESQLMALVFRAKISHFRHKGFIEELGLTEEGEDPDKYINYIEVAPGLVIDGRFRISINIPVTQRDVFKSSIAVNVMPFK